MTPAAIPILRALFEQGSSLANVSFRYAPGAVAHPVTIEHATARLVHRHTPLAAGLAAFPIARRDAPTVVLFSLCIDLCFLKRPAMSNDRRNGTPHQYRQRLRKL
jgi:hypothetical protein